MSSTPALRPVDGGSATHMLCCRGPLAFLPEHPTPPHTQGIINTTCFPSSHSHLHCKLIIQNKRLLHSRNPSFPCSVDLISYLLPYLGSAAGLKSRHLQGDGFLVFTDLGHS